MIIDLILVITGIVTYTILAYIQKYNSHSKITVVRLISRGAISSGSFVAVIKIIELLSQLENILAEGSENLISFTSFLMMILIRFRPFFLGLLISIVAIPFGQDNKDDKCRSSVIRESENFVTSVLSAREKEVARLAAQGYSNAQIAEKLFISVETVKRHMATVFEKLQIKSRLELKGLEF